MVSILAQAASGKRQAASGKRQAASGKRQAASGKRSSHFEDERVIERRVAGQVDALARQAPARRRAPGRSGAERRRGQSESRRRRGDSWRCPTRVGSCWRRRHRRPRSAHPLGAGRSPRLKGTPGVPVARRRSRNPPDISVISALCSRRQISLCWRSGRVLVQVSAVTVRASGWSVRRLERLAEPVGPVTLPGGLRNELPLAEEGSSRSAPLRRRPRHGATSGAGSSPPESA